MSLKRCKVCKEQFRQTRPMQPTCHKYECQVSYAQQVADKARKKREKVERAADRQKREKLKTRSDWIKDAQQAFNSFIRARDEGKACISCGASWGSGEVGGRFDCGHYRSVGSAPQHRFNERNAAAQCKKCNRYLAGRAVDYRIGLAKRIGIEALEQLESDNSTAKWTIDQLREIRDTYRAKLKELKRA